jgi:hypothetical protein
MDNRELVHEELDGLIVGMSTSMWCLAVGAFDSWRKNQRQREMGREWLKQVRTTALIVSQIVALAVNADVPYD